MTTMKALLAALLLAAPACAAEKYSINDSGDFAPTGQRVEFYDRYGWRSYSVDFDFGLDEGRTLSRDSKLKLKIQRRNGKSWTFSCKAKGRDAMTANINFLYGKGISVAAECRIPEKEFGRAVDLDPRDVGFPTLIFQAIVSEGQVQPGSQRGIYFLPGGDISTSELAAYASNPEDGLAVVFRSSR